MSDDDEAGTMAHLQEFQTLVLPPVPRPANNNNNHNHNHNHTSASITGERRTGQTMSNTSSSRTHQSHPHSHSHPHHHGHHAQHSVASEPYPTSKPSSSNKGGVRGRVTVVCAECKRLKLRCSRDRPCTSCIKRACTDRCRYRNDDQPLPSAPAPGEARSIVPIATPGDSVYRLVSINCVQCSTTNTKCDRREPCSQCIKSSGECIYPGLAPLAPPQEQYIPRALARLERIEAALTDLMRPECDGCIEGRLKCDGDGRNPCSWCLKRHHSGGVTAVRRGSLENEASSQQQHGAALGTPCTYSGYSEQARRYGLHSPQSSLHASTGIPSRDRSHYALRISSPPPPSSSHSTASGGGTEILSRIATSETQLEKYSRSHNHNFSHGHSLSHGSATSMTSGAGAGPGGGFGAAYGSASTLTPITPSHPSSLHQYAMSGGGSGGHSHSHSHSQMGGHSPYSQSEHHHQRTSSRHSPPHHQLASSHLQPHDQSPYHHEQRHESHRPRQLSLSNPSVQLPRPNSHHTPTNSSAQSQSGQFGFGSSNVSKTSKMPTPPGSGSSAGAGGGQQQPQSATSTKLPEISNILTLLSPAPMSSATDTKSPHPFPTPVSGGVGNGHAHGILSMGGGSTIQHLQSDVRGSSGVKPLSGYSGGGGDGSSRRGSTESHPRDALPSPSISTTPPHGSSGSRPTSAEAAKVAGGGYPTSHHHHHHHHHQRGPSDALREGGAPGAGDNKLAQARQYAFSKRDDEDEDDEMEVEIDEIENDMDP